ncbi:MAG: M24 family metallopeptidase [Candidatus Hodarchaeales archaeon]|jgi:Xaa-Pro aminopeptidase
MISQKEYQTRVYRLQQRMIEKEIGLTLVMYRPELYYFSGSAFNNILAIPIEGEPILLVRRPFERSKTATWVSTVFPLKTMKMLPSLIKKGGISSYESIGLELDVLPAKNFLHYKNLFPNSSLKDISGEIRRVRAVKSPSEIEKMKRAAHIADKGQEAVPEILTEGMTEVDLASQIDQTMRAAGHQGWISFRAWNNELLFSGHVLSGPNSAIPSYVASPTGGEGLYPSLPQGPSSRKIKRNEVVFVDIVGVYDGYHADETRLFCLGSLPRQLQQSYEVALEIHEHLEEVAKVGVPVSALHSQALEIAIQNDLQDHFMGDPYPVPFLGHGVGLQLDDYPPIAQGFDEPLEKNMTIALEPKFSFSNLGTSGIEDTFLITSAKAEQLTKAPRLVN